MKSRWIGLVILLPFTAIFFCLAAASFADLGGSSAWGAEDNLPFPKDATVTTLITTPRSIEGLTGDNQNNLHTGGLDTSPCPVWQVNLQKPTLTPVGFVVPAAGNCVLLGIAFNDVGDLFVADGPAETI